MCGVAAAVAAAVGGALASGLMGAKDAPAAPAIQSYTPEAANLTVEPPPAPTATPTFGQKSAEDLQKDASANMVKKNKKGRQALRIDLDPNSPTAALPGAGQSASGTVVPRG